MAESINARVKGIIERRRAEKRETLALRREEIFLRIPRIEQIEKRLDETGIKLINCVLDGSCKPEEAVIKIMQENRLMNAEKEELLGENGYSADYIDDRVQCEKCGDSGFVGEKICSCVRAELNRTLLSEANLSDKLSNQTFDSFRLDVYSSLPDPVLGISPRENAQSIFNLCARFAEGFPSGENLFFTGGCGLGKTFLSSAIANYLIEKGTDVLYISANSLFPILEDLHFNRSVAEENRFLVRHALECELLILDDLGAEFVTPFTSAELFRIINNRQLAGGSTIISTNLELGELKSRYSERIYSRIAGDYEVVIFLGDDIRRKLKNGGQK